MPYVSDKQRKFMHSQHPEIARKWDEEGKGFVKTKKKGQIKKAAEPTFESPLAQQTYDLISKMDDDEAAMFCQFVFGNYFEDHLDRNHDYFQKSLDVLYEVNKEQVRKTIAKMALTDPEAAKPYAEAFAEISKAEPQWREELYRRDQRGRFTTKVKPVASTAKPLNDRVASNMGITRDDAKYKKLSPSEKAQYQQEYMRLSHFLDTVGRSTSGDADVMYRVERGFGHPNGGTVEYHRRTGTGLPLDLMHEKGTRIVGAEARHADLQYGGARFSAQRAMEENPEFVSNWMTAGAGGANLSEQRTEARWSRLNQAGDLANAGAQPGTARYNASRAAQFVGSHGPEAEKVIGPHIRRTAYRYRGTEKTPDKQTVAQYERAVHGAKMRSAIGPGDESPDRPARYRNTKVGPPTAPAAVQMAAQRVAAERRAPTWEERSAGRDILADHLKSRMPKRSLYELQLKSGNTPPSEGFIVDKDGKVVTQAVGYGDDHYLPFNLKNMKSLKGGEYVRTRSVGGLTSEDVYTGLMSGARRVTVVSRSGTFTMEFEEDFTGKRRYNDKALRMTRRYQQILDSVQSEQVERRKDVSPSIRAGITARVMEENPGLTRRDLRDEIESAVQEYKSSPELTDEDRDLIQRLHEAGMRREPSRDAKEFKRAVENEILQNKGFYFRLDGRGYEDAAKALEEQFPYYIKTNAVLDEANSRGQLTGVLNLERDRGYVEPGRNRPTAARAGMYGTKENPKGEGKEGGKFSASQANYQGWGERRGSKTGPASDAAPSREGERTPAKKAATPPKGVSDVVQVRADRALARRLRGSIRNPEQSSNPVLKAKDEELNALLKTPEGKKALEELRDSPDTTAAAANDPDLRRVIGEQKNPTQPEAATFQRGAPLSDEARQKQINAFSKQIRFTAGGQDLATVSDEAFSAEMDLVDDIATLREKNGGPFDREEALKAAAGLKIPSSTTGSISLLMVNDAIFGKQVEARQKIAELRRMGKGAAPAAPQAAPAQPAGQPNTFIQGQNRNADLMSIIEDQNAIRAALEEAKDTGTWDDNIHTSPNEIILEMNQESLGANGNRNLNNLNDQQIEHYKNLLKAARKHIEGNGS